VATELKENVSDEQLSEMLTEACTKEFGKSVDLSVYQAILVVEGFIFADCDFFRTDFEGVMKRAGVL
jgi:hypothetical protein